MSGVELDEDSLFWARLAKILSDALASYAEERPDEFAQRVQWCRETGLHGMSLTDLPGTDGRSLGVVWAGQPWIAVDRAVFDPDAYFEPMDYVRFDPPDDLSTLDGGGVA